MRRRSPSPTPGTEFKHTRTKWFYSGFHKSARRYTYWPVAVLSAGRHRAILNCCPGVAELADALDSKSSGT